MCKFEVRNWFSPVTSIDSGQWKRIWIKLDHSIATSSTHSGHSLPIGYLAQENLFELQVQKCAVEFKQHCLFVTQ